MKLIAKKPCSFGGKKFYVGDEIPAEYVLNPKLQEQMGVLTIVYIDGSDSDSGSGSADGSCDCDEHPIVISDPTFSILVKTSEGEMELEPTDDGMQDIFTVLIGRAEDAAPVIEKMDDNDSLVLLHLADSRKSVKALAEARAKALEAEEEGEQ